MSIVTETFLMCDHCFKNFGVDNRSQTAAQHRKNSRENGWKTGKRGKDYCDKCLDKYYINLKS